MDVIDLFLAGFANLSGVKLPAWHVIPGLLWFWFLILSRRWLRGRLGRRPAFPFAICQIAPGCVTFTFAAFTVFDGEFGWSESSVTVVFHFLFYAFAYGVTQAITVDFGLR